MYIIIKGNAQFYERDDNKRHDFICSFDLHRHTAVISAKDGLYILLIEITTLVLSSMWYFFQSAQYN